MPRLRLTGAADSRTGVAVEGNSSAVLIERTSGSVVVSTKFMVLLL